MRLPVRLGFGGEQRGGFRAVAGVQAFLLAGFVVMDVINPAVAAKTWAYLQNRCDHGCFRQSRMFGAIGGGLAQDR